MDTRTTLSVSEARKNIFSIIDQVEKLGAVYTLTEKGRPKAVIMSAEEFESWVETFEVMKDWPTYKEDIEQVNRDIKSGAYKNYPTLEEVMLEQGYLMDKKGKYDISNSVRTKSKKTARKAAK